MSVAGQHGLFRYVAQARGGAIGENMETGQRKVFNASSRISTLADIAIYTSEGELTALFSKAIPNYDADRFYVSHMRKVVGWYDQIAKYASFDFVKEEEQGDAPQD